MIVALIPAHDEAPRIGAVISAARAFLPVIVVDDGSSDDTADRARAAGAEVVEQRPNQGKGMALRTGFRRALEDGADAILTLDADGQHDPAEIERLVGPIVRDEADFVVGSRRLGVYEPEAGAAGAARNVGLTVYTSLVNLLGGTQMTDVSNGFRAIRASGLAAIVFTEDQFHNPELLMGAARSGLRIVEVPITIHRRQAGTSKKGSTVRYGLGFLRVILRSWLR